MTQTSWVTFLVVLLWICAPSMTKKRHYCGQLRECFARDKPAIIVADNYNGIVNHGAQVEQRCGMAAQTNENMCTVLVNETPHKRTEHCRLVLQIRQINDSHLLFMSKWHFKHQLSLHVLLGRQCNETLESVQSSGHSSTDKAFNHLTNGNCSLTTLNTMKTCDNAVYNEDYCNIPEITHRFGLVSYRSHWCRDPDYPVGVRSLFNSKNNDKYIINVTDAKQNCYNCNNPVKVPEEDIHVDTGLGNAEGEDIDAAQAVTWIISNIKAQLQISNEAMNTMAQLSMKMNDSSAALSMGEGVTGVLVKQTERVELQKVLLGYSTPNSTINILENPDQLSGFSRSITVPKQAFEQAFNVTDTQVVFAAVVRFLSMAKDVHNSTVLYNEVLAIEMGGVIANLTENVSITFQNVKQAGIPSCRSWNGQGARPNWTEDGCVTLIDGDITCHCTHLTFFAVLMSPLNTTISAADLNSLTYITYIGCSLSLFFLCVILFMHFLIRKTKANKATNILVQLVLAMSLLNLTFLSNNWVAKLQSHVGCKVMAAVMHYSMLATFTWFAVEAFHLCLQLHMAGKITIHRYILKVSLSSWALPGVVVTILLIKDKYGELIINTDEDNVTMCWITDNNVHYIINIGYYVLVFLFTFTTFIIILSWLFHLKGNKAGTAPQCTTSKSIFTIMGLCCLLGVTWSFAFFAYGALRIPSYYIFTTLNSFQGFFLFLYYYNIRRMIGENAEDDSKTGSSSSTSGTMNTTLNSYNNPYDFTAKK